MQMLAEHALRNSGREKIEIALEWRVISLAITEAILRGASLQL